MAFESDDLLQVAAELIASSNPSASHIARSISTSYFAIFQHFIFETTKIVIGTDDKRLTRAADHLQRSISHGDLSRRCKDLKRSKIDFPEPTIDYATCIFESQDERHKADYARNVVFVKQDAQFRLDQVRDAIAGFDQSEEHHRRAFVVWANFDRRNP